MRILVLAEWYPSEADPIAGMFVRDQARAAASAHDVLVLVHDRGRPGEAAPVARAEEDGVPTVRIRTRASPSSTRGRIAFLRSAARELRRLRKAGWTPNIVHAHVFSAGMTGLLLSRGRYPVLVSEHNSDFIEGRVLGRDARVAHYVLRHAALVCAVSRTLLRHLEEFEPAGRYEVVPNVVDVDPFLAAARRRPEAGRGPARFLVVASLTRQKGLEHLLQALGELHSARIGFILDVVGEGPERAQLEELARTLVPDGSVRFHGARPRTEVTAYMARSDALVLPSIVETFGVVAVEAVAAGLPVIATTALPGHELFSARGFGVIVPPGDPGALRDALQQMLDHAFVLPSAAAADFARSFSPPAIAERWRAVYRRVARVS